jgi:prephenate dehydrogenase
MRIALLGTGLIGGSLALAWQQSDLDCTIVGYDEPDVLEQADERGALDAKAADPVTAVEEADVVVLATPLGAMLELMDTIAEHVPAGAVVTDVGSVKRPVHDQARDVLPDDAPFVGGHPMAGAEHAGIAHADPLLFENATYVLCPPDADLSTDTLRSAYPNVVALVEATGARPMLLDAVTHDRIAAAVSHLPQLVAVALVGTLADHADRDQALELAAGGFRDMTRIASSPFNVWRDILVGNEGAILDAVSSFSRQLQRLRNRLITDDYDALEDAFEKAHDTRDDVPRNRKGFLQPLADVYVRAADEPGVLHRLTGLLHDAGLNIKDIELLTYREDSGGTFRLSFESDADAATAVEALEAADVQANRP